MQNNQVTTNTKKGDGIKRIRDFVPDDNDIFVDVCVVVHWHFILVGSESII